MAAKIKNATPATTPSRTLAAESARDGLFSGPVTLPLAIMSRITAAAANAAATRWTTLAPTGTTPPVLVLQRI